MIRLLCLVILLVILLIFNIVLPKIKKEHFESNFINSVVDKIYVINMDKDKDRMEILDKKMKVLGLEYQRISGVDGKKVYPKYKDKTKLRPGQIGCLLSHIEVLKDAIKNNYNNIMVLEDDILFHHNFHQEFKKKYQKILKNEKRFDLIYLGCTQSMGGPGFWGNTKMKDEYYDNKYTDGTYAMLINKNIFEVIKKQAESYKIPIDTSISNNILSNNKYKTFAFYPHLIITDVSLLSNTDGEKRNLKNYLKSNKVDTKNFDLPKNL